MTCLRTQAAQASGKSRAMLPTSSAWCFEGVHPLRLSLTNNLLCPRASVLDEDMALALQLQSRCMSRYVWPRHPNSVVYQQGLILILGHQLWLDPLASLGNSKAACGGSLIQQEKFFLPYSSHLNIGYSAAPQRIHWV